MSLGHDQHWAVFTPQASFKAGQTFHLLGSPLHKALSDLGASGCFVKLFSMSKSCRTSPSST